MSAAASPDRPGKRGGLQDKGFFPKLVPHHNREPEVKRWLRREVSQLPSLPVAFRDTWAGQGERRNEASCV